MMPYQIPKWRRRFTKRSRSWGSVNLVLNFDMNDHYYYIGYLFPFWNIMMVFVSVWISMKYCIVLRLKNIETYSLPMTTCQIPPYLCSRIFFNSIIMNASTYSLLVARRTIIDHPSYLVHDLGPHQLGHLEFLCF